MTAHKPDDQLSHHGPSGRDDPYGRRIFFHGVPDTTSGRFVLECSRCGKRRRQTFAELSRAHFPGFLWLPLMRYSHWARCPHCESRAWIRIGIHRV